MNHEKTTFQIILKQVRRNQETAKNEEKNAQSNKKPWERFGADHLLYEQKLGLQPGTLMKLVSDLCVQGITPFGLDVGSDTSALRSLDIPGVAIGLGETRTQEMIEEDLKHNRYFVKGDVLRRSTWRKLHEVMRAHEITEGFPLVLEVADGGLTKITGDPNVHFNLAQEMWSVLNPNGGRMFLQMRNNDKFFLSSYPLINNLNWITFLRESGIKASNTGEGIALARQPENPASLPTNIQQIDVYNYY